MENTFKIFGAAIMCVAVILTLRSASRDAADMVKIISSVLLAGFIIFTVSPLLELIFGIAEGSGVNTYISVMIKSLGVAFVTHVCASVCRDCGENTIAGYAELAGKIEMLMISVPLIKEILGIAEGLAAMI